MMVRLLPVLLTLTFLVPLAHAESPAPSQPADAAAAAKILHMVDYLRDSYSESPGNDDKAGHASAAAPSNYAELIQFADLINFRIGQLPASNQRARLSDRALALEDAVAARAGAARVTQLADALRAGLLQAYPELARARQQQSPVDKAGAQSGAAGHLARSRALLEQSVAAYRAGVPRQAQSLALRAYLDGFELAEPSLKAVDAGLLRRIEDMMRDYRQMIDQQIGQQVPPAQLQARAADIDAALQTAADRLAHNNSSAWGSFVAGFIILGREGLEAILVLAAIFAFLRQSGRSEARRYVHGGWILALLAGAATWFAASHVIEISGAGRETTEGVVALVAAALLLYVGWWLHSRSYAQRWQQFVSERMQGALASRSLWALTLLAFLTVYREIFETILFYQALWIQGQHTALLLGLVAAATALAGVSWALFRFGVRLPLGTFFTASAVLIAVLAVVFTGNGVAALQEAGKLPLDPVAFFRLPLLGIHPNQEGLFLQALVLTAVLAGFGYNHLRNRNPARS